MFKEQPIKNEGLTQLSPTFEKWVQGRSISAWGTNAGTRQLAFQGWRHFKEAFAPELVQYAVDQSPISVKRCLDPFGGSGTTALASQFLGVEPIAIEVNPFLADLIEAKVSSYDPRTISRGYADLVRTANSISVRSRSILSQAPITFVEPGKNGRWIFNKSVAKRIAAYQFALREVSDVNLRRLFRVLLGGILIDVSNVLVSGKGRRYRRNWNSNRYAAIDVDEAFCKAVERAVSDIILHSNRAERKYSVFCGDSRRLLKSVGSFELAVFSPPYPNSFDYTDVYNVELWALGYLRGSEANVGLRKETLSSHVQIKRAYLPPPSGSKILSNTLAALKKRRSRLWNKFIPEMVGAYFADMHTVMREIARQLPEKGQMWIVVGDSRYAGVNILTAKILSELASSINCRVIKKEAFRSMRTSPQQGGDHELSETLLVLGRH